MLYLRFLVSNLLVRLALFVFLSAGPLLAQAQSQAPVKRPGLGEIFSNMLPMILMVFFIFYFLVTRPQKLKEEEHAKLLDSLKKGDMVISSGGVIGRVSGIEDDHILVEVASGVKVKFDKANIARRYEKVAAAKSEGAVSAKKED